MCLLPTGISYYWDWQGYTQMAFFIHCDTYVYVYYLRMHTFMLFVSHLSSKGPDTQLRRHLMTSPMMIFPRGFHVEEEHQVSGLLFQGNQLHDDDLRHAKSTNCAFPVGSMTLGFTMSFHVFCSSLRTQLTVFDIRVIVLLANFIGLVRVSFIFLQIPGFQISSRAYALAPGLHGTA